MSTSLDKYLPFADQPTPKPMEGRWTMIAPDGQFFTGTSPFECVRMEVDSRVPPEVALGRIARSMQEDEADEEMERGWPLIALGFGAVEVAEGHHEGRPALIFGRNGTGVIGEATPPNRHATHEETLAVVTFDNAASLDVVVGKLATIRAKHFGATPPAEQGAGS